MRLGCMANPLGADFASLFGKFWQLKPINRGRAPQRLDASKHWQDITEMHVLSRKQIGFDPAFPCLRLRGFALATAFCFVAGCAGIKVTPLDQNGLRAKSGRTNQEEGLRYYMPMPYLIVAELPPTIGQSTTSSNGLDTSDSNGPFANPPPSDGTLPTNAIAAPGAAAVTGSKGKEKPSQQSQNPSANTQNSKGMGTNTTSGPSNSSPTSPPPISDLSFGGSTPQYVIKLVYLPDMRHPMAMTQSAGIGTAEMKPELQDGWMLTTLDATADAKVAESLQAIGSMVGSAFGAGTGTKAAGAAASNLPAPGGGPGGARPTRMPSDLSSYYDALKGVLRPGLYRFDYDANGTLTGISAVEFFTGNGTVKPGPDGGFPTNATRPTPAAQ